MSYNVWLWAIGSVQLLSALSLSGVILLPARRRKTFNAIIFLLVSFACGAMLGNALFNLVPESFKHGADEFTTGMLIALGVVIYFSAAKVLKLHCHHITGGHCDDTHSHEIEDNEEEHDEHAHEQHLEAKPGERIHINGWMTMKSHMLDNFTDGIGIGSSYLISLQAGISTTIGVFAHELPHEFGCFAVLVKAGFTRWQAIAINLISAMVATAGCVGVLWLGAWVQGLADWLTPVCAGLFLSIALSGLMPEMQKETDTRRSIIQILLVLLGLAAIGAAKMMFPE